MKNPASGIALIFPAIGFILIALGGYLYFQEMGVPDLTPLELWLGPAIAGGIGVIFLVIGAVMYSAFRSSGPDETDTAKDDGINNFNPHDLP